MQNWCGHRACCFQAISTDVGYAATRRICCDHSIGTDTAYAATRQSVLTQHMMLPGNRCLCRLYCGAHAVTWPGNVPLTLLTLRNRLLSFDKPC
eukprot:1180330-Rhodomonas_salina.3